MIASARGRLVVVPFVAYWQYLLSLYWLMIQGLTLSLSIQLLFNNVVLENFCSNIFTMIATCHEIFTSKGNIFIMAPDAIYPRTILLHLYLELDFFLSSLYKCIFLTGYPNPFSYHFLNMTLFRLINAHVFVHDDEHKIKTFCAQLWRVRMHLYNKHISCPLTVCGIDIADCLTWESRVLLFVIKSWINT